MEKQNLLLITLGILIISAMTVSAEIGGNFTSCNFTMAGVTAANGQIVSGSVPNGFNMTQVNFSVAPNYGTALGNGGKNVTQFSVNFTTASSVNVTANSQYLVVIAPNATAYNQYNLTLNLSGLLDQTYTAKIEVSNGSAGTGGTAICSSYTTVKINRTQIGFTLDSTTPTDGTSYADTSAGLGSYNITTTNQETIDHAIISFGSNTYTMTLGNTNSSQASYAVTTATQLADSSYPVTFTVFDTDGAYYSISVPRTVTYRLSRDGFPPQLLQQQLQQQVSVTTPKKSNLTLYVVALFIILALAGAFGKLGN